MTQQDPREKREQWIIDYLYGELDVDQKRIFDNALENDVELKKMFDEHCEIDAIIPKGVQPIIQRERMQGVRWVSFRALRAQKIPSFWQKIAECWHMQVSIRIQALAMLAMFTIGFFVSSGLNIDDVSGATQAGPKGANDRVLLSQKEQLGSPLSFIKDKDYRIIDVNLKAYDVNKGDVEFTFGLASQSKVKGNLNNPKIRNLLLQTFQNDSQDEVRLQLTQLLGAYIDVDEVRQSLIFTLLNDPNPGVRYHAAENLVKIADQTEVRAALLKALAEDVNPGIRVEVFLVASKKIDDDLIKVLKKFGVNDANTFIRERSKKIVKDFGEVKNPRSEGVRAITL